MSVGIIVLIVVAVIGLWAVMTYNGFVQGKNQCEEAFSTMDVYLKKRFDLIPNLVATVKGYAKHESETLEKVISARNAGTRLSPEEKAQDENQITGAIRQIFALSESYPDLKANTNFIDLQGQLKKIEEDIANSRKYYNAVVKEFNTKCETIPSVFIANLGHFTKKPLYAVDEAEERKNVKVEF
ncbi:MAG: LemA family protein [Treponema sp.]|nr:LemA family protein [Candidatus Treponema equifaecale]